MQNIK